MAREDAKDLERSGQQTSLNGQDWSTTKQSDRHNTAKNGGPLHPTLGKRTEHDDDDDDCRRGSFNNVMYNNPLQMS